MRISKSFCYAVCLFIFIGVALILGCSKPSTKVVEETQNDRSQPTDNTSSLAGALFTLAEERYSNVTNRGETWILTRHNVLDNSNVIKVTDGKYTVVSIPVLEPEMAGFDAYISHYNTFNLIAADRLYLQGETNEAKVFYEILAHFAKSEPYKTEIQFRLDYLASTNGTATDRDAYIAALNEYSQISPIAKMGRLSEIKAQAVTNLATINLEAFSLEK